MKIRHRFPEGHGPRVAALGGGHGLAASLRALRRVTDNLTAIVGVSDDGGSSGRLRKEFGVLPPGDLRMALAALCGDDTWGRTWSRVIQHRFGGSGDLRGHCLGNMLIATLWEETADVVAGLDWVAALLGAQGRVLPVSVVPLEIEADVSGADPSNPGAVSRIRGQVAVATTHGRVLDVRVVPSDPPGCAEALAAVTEADFIVLGPGSWYTSVIAPLLVPDLRKAVEDSDAKRILVLNLSESDSETHGFTASEYVRVLAGKFPELRLDAVVADSRVRMDADGLRDECQKLGAALVMRPVASAESPAEGKHDPDLLAAAFAEITGRGRIAPWR
ncbi:MAG: uridine diphosphate-N-acetylglucosamine-binding protein YvcK [Candidatus Nanopelagicales bacterium]|nr:uridine diphosphate-N-acetylglucosamine-binding protein YvcK [Candidatus Nanopelagicales bacterium]